MNLRRIFVGGRTGWIHTLGLPALLVLVVLVYWPGLNGGFVFDDITNIVTNGPLQVRNLDLSSWLAATFSSPSSDLRRPLAMLTFAINIYFSGLDPWAMKLTNVLIHVFNTCLVFGLAREISALGLPGLQTSSAWASRRLPLFAAAFWALNPINLMAVLYVVQRMESLSHVFVFAALWFYVRQRRLGGSSPRALLLAGTGLALGAIVGTLSKESAVLVTLYAWCLEVTVIRAALGKPQSRRGLNVLFTLLLWLPGAVAASLLFWRATRPGAYFSRDFGMTERLLTEGRVLVDYAHWTVLPSIRSLGLYHDDYAVSTGLLSPPSTLLCLLAIAAALAIAWRVRGTRPLFALGVLWYFAAHTLTGTFLPLELVFEHRNYFASLGIALALGDALLVWPESDIRRMGGAVVAALLVLLATGATWIRSNEWDHPVRFSMSEAAKHPGSPRATYEKARTLVQLTKYDPKSKYGDEALQAIEAARRVPGTNLLPSQAALIFSARTGRPIKQEWWDDLRGKLASQPLGPPTLGALTAMTECSNLKLCAFPPEQMIAVFSAALTHGEHPELMNIYASYAAYTLKDPALAQRAWESAIATKPSEPQYHANLARLLIATGRQAEAREHIAAIRRLGKVGENEALARSVERAAAKH